MDKFVDNIMLKIWKKLALFGGMCLFLDMAFVVVNIILRAFNHPVFGSTEIIRYAALVAAALGLAYNQFEDGNIRVTLVLDKLSQKGRDILGLIVEIILTGGFVLIAYYMIRYTLSLKTKGDLTSEMHLPVWIFSGILFIGLVVMILASIMKCIDRGYCLSIKKDYEERKNERYQKEVAGL